MIYGRVSCHVHLAVSEGRVRYSSDSPLLLVYRMPLVSIRSLGIAVTTIVRTAGVWVQSKICILARAVIYHPHLLVTSYSISGTLIPSAASSHSATILL
jgi:hypothetical protein